MPQFTRSHRRFALFATLLAIVAASADAVGSAHAASPRRARPSVGYVRVLVVARRHSSLRSLRRQLRLLGARPGRTVRDLRLVSARIPRRRLASFVLRLERMRHVRYVERDRVVMRITTAEQYTPSDPLWPQQWGAQLIEAPTGWAVTRGSKSVVVAVLDTGVDFSQPDLQGAFVPGHDFVNNDADPSDDNGHGTATAGIIAARADNGLGGSGLCPQCSIMPVKVTGADGTGTNLNVASGITWAVDHGARVINLSLGGSNDAAIADAVRYATGRGVLVVAAAGNNGNSAPFYPAADPGVLSVAATQPDDGLYWWSTYGSWVAVAAPGCDLTTLRAEQYGQECGTSASSPLVAGLAGLAMSYSPTSSADAIMHAITSSAHAMANVSYGRVDVAGTLAALGAVFKSAPAPAPGSSSMPLGDSPGAPAAPPPAASASKKESSRRPTWAPRRAVRGHEVRRRRPGRAPLRARRLRVELSRRGH